jgi:hypothetical protein
MLGLSQRGLIGMVLMIVGTVALLPAVTPRITATVGLVAVVAAGLVTLGTYLVGTDVDGRPV